jgi:hypothetical protein
MQLLEADFDVLQKGNKIIGFMISSRLEHQESSDFISSFPGFLEQGTARILVEGHCLVLTGPFGSRCVIDLSSDVASQISEMLADDRSNPETLTLEYDEHNEEFVIVLTEHTALPMTAIQQSA